jgi:hypothetical protein
MIGDNKDEKDTRRRLSAENKEGVRDQKQATSDRGAQEYNQQ